MSAQDNLNSRLGEPCRRTNKSIPRNAARSAAIPLSGSTGFLGPIANQPSPERGDMSFFWKRFMEIR